MAFLLCDPGWCVHKSDVQNKWDDSTHTQGGGASEQPKAPFLRPGVGTRALYGEGNRVPGTRKSERGRGRDWSRGRERRRERGLGWEEGGNGDVNGDGDGDGAGAGAGTGTAKGVDANKGTKDGNGDGSGDGAGAGTRTGVETRRQRQDRNGDESGDGNESRSGDGNGNEDGIGIGRAEERRRSARNHTRTVDTTRHFYSTRVIISADRG